MVCFLNSALHWDWAQYFKNATIIIIIAVGLFTGSYWQPLFMFGRYAVQKISNMLRRYIIIPPNPVCVTTLACKNLIHIHYYIHICQNVTHSVLAIFLSVSTL